MRVGIIFVGMPMAMFAVNKYIMCVGVMPVLMVVPVLMCRFAMNMLVSVFFKCGKVSANQHNDYCYCERNCNILFVNN